MTKIFVQIVVLVAGTALIGYLGEENRTLRNENTSLEQKAVLPAGQAIRVTDLPDGEWKISQQVLMQGVYYAFAANKYLREPAAIFSGDKLPDLVAIKQSRLVNNEPRPERWE